MSGLDRDGAQAIIHRLGLQPHPEGGWYRETWRAEGPGRGAATAIHFLLQAGERSHWHRVRDASEVWLWHAGAPLALSLAPTAAGPVTAHRLGPDVLAGEAPQVVVAPDAWQAAESLGAWTLVSCVVAPAFEFSAFELAPPGWAPGQPRG
ncbi:MAG: cupin domain-containing protein [Myxococcales bacterium]|nr:cupin domain-containing protein [Myxococcales bacterium]